MNYKNLVRFTVVLLLLKITVSIINGFYTIFPEWQNILLCRLLEVTISAYILCFLYYVVHCKEKQITWMGPIWIIAVTSLMSYIQYVYPPLLFSILESPGLKTLTFQIIPVLSGVAFLVAYIELTKNQSVHYQKQIMYIGIAYLIQMFLPLVLNGFITDLNSIFIRCIYILPYIAMLVLYCSILNIQMPRTIQQLLH